MHTNYNLCTEELEVNMLVNNIVKISNFSSFMTKTLLSIGIAILLLLIFTLAYRIWHKLYLNKHMEEYKNNILDILFKNFYDKEKLKDSNILSVTQLVMDENSFNWDGNTITKNGYVEYTSSKGGYWLDKNNVKHSLPTDEQKETYVSPIKYHIIQIFTSGVTMGLQFEPTEDDDILMEIRDYLYSHGYEDLSNGQFPQVRYYKNIWNKDICEHTIKENKIDTVKIILYNSSIIVYLLFMLSILAYTIHLL